MRGDETSYADPTNSIGGHRTNCRVAERGRSRHGPRSPVGIFLFAFQLALQEGDERRQFRLLLGSASDLTGFSPPRDSDDLPQECPYLLAGAHLRGKVLNLADLDHVDLTGADLSFTHLGGARIRQADLTDATLRVAYIYFADLRCACLRDANLRETDLRNADLRGADLRGAKLDRADLRGCLIDEETQPTAGGIPQPSGDAVTTVVSPGGPAPRVAAPPATIRIIVAPVRGTASALCPTTALRMRPPDDT